MQKIIRFSDILNEESFGFHGSPEDDISIAMRPKNANEEAEVPRFLYHGTHEKFISSIKQNGLTTENGKIFFTTTMFNSVNYSFS